MSNQFIKMDRTPQTKYYWYVWSHPNAGGGITNVEAVCFSHPFKEIAKIRNELNRHVSITLINWKEITKAEFDMFIEVIPKIKFSKCEPS